MKYFWSFHTALPAGVGFSLFGPAHLIWIAAAAAVFAAGGFLYLRAGARGRARAQLAVTVFILLNELFQDAFLAAGGHFDVYQLPLHLCGLAVFVGFAHGIVLEAMQKRESGFLKAADSFLGQVRFGLCMPGALLAVLFPDWTVYPPFSFISSFGFVNHILISASAFWLSLPDSFRIKPADIIKPAAFLLVTVPVIYRFDIAEKTNYFFLIKGPKGSPLRWLQETWPDHYLLAYALLAAAVISLWYAVWIGIKKSRCRM